MSDSKDMEEWAKSVNLTPDTLSILQKEGFTSFLLVCKLTPEEINESFKKTKLLALAQCLALQEAVIQLKMLQLSPASETTPKMPYQATCSDSNQCTIQYQQHDLTGPPHFTEYSVRNTKDKVVRLLMMGKTGGGKSSTANTILGDDAFNCEMRFDSVTDECSLKSNTRDDLTIEIMDSAGLFDTRKSHEEVSVDIARAVTCLHPGPHAILYVVRIGRFTQEDEDVFIRLMELFDKTLENYTIVVFTGGDELERRGKKIDEILDKAPDNLRSILKACNNRYVVFNNMATNQHRQVKLLLSYVHKISDENDGVPYTCPKYFYISEAVEQEVNERMAKAEQIILKEKVYVQELEARTRQAEEDVAREKEELQKKEQERQREMKEEDERRRVELESLKQQLENQQMNEEQRREETEALLRKLEEEREQQKREMEEEKKKDKENFKRKEREMEEKMTKMMTEIHEEKLRIRETEIKKLKDSVAENNIKDCVQFLKDLVDKYDVSVNTGDSGTRCSGCDYFASPSTSRSHQRYPSASRNGIVEQDGSDNDFDDRATYSTSPVMHFLGPPGGNNSSIPVNHFLDPLGEVSRFTSRYTVPIPENIDVSNPLYARLYLQDYFRKMNRKE